MNDPANFNPEAYIEMPAKVLSLETIDGEVWAVLEGGATIRVSDLFRDETPGTSH